MRDQLYEGEENIYMDMDTNCNYPQSTIKNHNYSPITGPPPLMKIDNKEMCAGCGRSIDDRFLLRVMETSWHESCLQCSVCQDHLTRSCYVKDKRLFCKIDYDQLFGAKCKRCLQSVPSNELVMRTMGDVYHLRCFSCIICGHQLQKGDQFVMKDGQLFCRLDFEKEFAMMPMSPKLYFGSGDEDSSMEDNESDGGKGPKRPRTILTTSQRRKFKASFEINPKPCRKVRETLAAETGLSVRVVQVWFQNQRAKVKKLARRGAQDGGDRKQNRGQKRKQKIETEDNDESALLEQSSTVSSLQPLTPHSGETPHYGQLRGFETQPPSPVPYGHPHHDFNSDNSLGLESLDMLPSHHGTLINPIDKLYSMHSSYFNAE